MSAPAGRLRAALDDLGTPPGSVPARRAHEALASLGEVGQPGRGDGASLYRRARTIAGRLLRRLGIRR